VCVFLSSLLLFYGLLSEINFMMMMMMMMMMMTIAVPIEN